VKHKKGEVSDFGPGMFLGLFHTWGGAVAHQLRTNETALGRDLPRGGIDFPSDGSGHQNL
jgi:hypothetical protein